MKLMLDESVSAMQLLSVITVLLCLGDVISVTSAEPASSTQDEDMYWDYIVIGAGPAGLQMGHFLEKARRNYVILERSNISGEQQLRFFDLQYTLHIAHVLSEVHDMYFAFQYF